MAAEQMKKVASHLTCPVCYELYKKPKYLPCYHSYCEQCLVKLQKAGSDSITCPECRKTSAIPSGGIKQLPNNFFINRIVDEVALKEKVTGEEDVRCDLCVREDPAVVLCFDCGVFLCSHCHESHKYSREYQGHSMSQLKELRKEKKDINVRPKAKPLLCQEHDMELNFYCGTCEQLVCHYCTTTDHNGHEHNTVKKMANKNRAELDDIIKPVEEMIGELSKAHQKVTTTREKVEVQATEVDQQIDDYYDQLQRRLQQQREELKKELHEVSSQKKKALSLQLEQMEHTQGQLESMKELNNAIKSGSDQEALFMKKQVTEDVKRMTDGYKQLKTEPVELATMQFIPVEVHQNSFPQFANVFYGDADPLTSMAENIPSLAYVNINVNFTIVTKNAQGDRCSKGGNKVISQVQSSSTGDVIPVAVKDNQDGTYSASVVSQQAGEVKLSVIINGRHIQGSPYSVRCRNYFALNVPSKTVNDDGRMGEPWGIAFGKDGMWAVVDRSNPCVYIFDSQDQVVTKFGTCGNANGQLNYPAGVAFDDDNHLYVVNNNNDRVQKFNIRGEYMLKFGNHGSNNGQLLYPVGITVHNKRVYVADPVNCRISVFQCDGNFSQTIGQSGELHSPYDVAVTNNQLLVANYGGHCISIFTLDGNYISKFGKHGTGRGDLYGPSSLIIDMHGSIIVTECGNNRVSVFNKDGVFIHCFGSKGSAEGQFSDPHGIALSPNGSIYISDRGNKRIQIFSDY